MRRLKNRKFYYSSRINQPWPEQQEIGFLDKTCATDSYDFEQNVFELWASVSLSLLCKLHWLRDGLLAAQELCVYQLTLQFGPQGLFSPQFLKKLNSRLYSDFMCFSFNVLSLSQDPI